jgi:hypothetical protein
MPPDQQDRMPHSTPSHLVESTTSKAESSAALQGETHAAANGSGAAKTAKKKEKRRPPDLDQSAPLNGASQHPQSADNLPVPTSASETCASVAGLAPSTAGQPIDPARTVEAVAGQGGSKSTSPAAGTIPVVMLPVSKIYANDFNANQMTQEDQDACTAEARRLGRLPKPLVVRPEGDRYEVVDGEHGLIAARTIGWPEVSCQVIECDELEAMRQNFTRNLHGKLNPLKHGRN